MTIFNLEEELKKIAWYLPSQVPIKDFFHQNILMSYINMPFEEALIKASKLFKARSYMELSYYRNNFENNKINPDNLDKALDYFLPKEFIRDREFIYHALFFYKEIKNYQTLLFLTRQEQIKILELIHAQEPEPAHDVSSIMNLITAQVGANFEHEVNQLLFRLLGSYLDQGVSLWPHLDQWPSFQEAICYEAKESILPLAPFLKNTELYNLLTRSCEEIVLDILSKILADRDLFTRYIQETLFAHPGWSGMIKMLTLRPDTLSKPCNINLAQLLAVKLALQIQYIQNSHVDFKPIRRADLKKAQVLGPKPFSPNCLSLAYLILSMPEHFLVPDKKLFKILHKHFLQKIWHRAMEQSHYRRIFSLFKHQNNITNKTQEKIFQVVFCIDDREGSFRRLLEKENQKIETFATAGFFGIDCYFKPQNDAIQKMCPGNIDPRHIVTEHINPAAKSPRGAALFELALFMSRHGANSTLLGLVSAYTIGHLSLLSLLVSMLHPVKLFRSRRLVLGTSPSELIFEHNQSQVQEDGLILGYTHDEMADRIFDTLSSMGMRRFSRFIFFIGHGSSSVNNPHFAAYDCQACSCHPGAVNARIFAAMANLVPVRKILQNRGMHIPAETIFVGGFHDTCTDQVALFETNNFSNTDKLLFDEFMCSIKSVREKNAQERCKKFSLVPKSISAAKALREVEHRAHALFEPRPELGHATNALAVVARRERSSHINFERRAFLQSYDPFQDAHGEILNKILSAVIPVCGHVNLDYYFSRLDPAIYGCGTKLSHNVCSLIGVGNGLDDDLRTGLPIQMTEMHDPLRLLIIIEQQPELIARIAHNNTEISPWIKNEWVRIASLDPHEDRLSMFVPSTNSFEDVL
jgi:uncharacterized protein YbcC (UPF0753/DUF2309 family)